MQHSLRYLTRREGAEWLGSCRSDNGLWVDGLR